MKYQILGGEMPAVEIQLEANEQIKCEAGGMSWMSANLEMQTQSGGLGKMFTKAFTGERLFQNTYTAKGGPGYLGISSSFPGSIVAIELTGGKEIICQKSAYLASTPGVEITVFFQKKLGAGFFGGEGFIMQKISGEGTVFLEIDGSIIEKDLAAGEQMVLDTGYLAMLDGTCQMDIVSVKGVKNALLGGEGLFNTTVTGPGHVVLQTMPAYQVANSIIPYIPSSGN